MEATSHTETLLLIYQTTRCHIQENAASIVRYGHYILIVVYQIRRLGLSGNGILWNISRQ